MNEKELSKVEVDQCIHYWQQQLNLLHWRVVWTIVEDKQVKIPRALMEITPTRLRHLASIAIKQSTYDQFSYCSREFQGYLVHELTHLVFDPIVEEHSLQTEFGIQDERHSENLKRFKRTVEKAVEHIAVQIVEVVPLYVAVEESVKVKPHIVVARSLSN